MRHILICRSMCFVLRLTFSNLCHVSKSARACRLLRAVAGGLCKNMFAFQVRYNGVRKFSSPHVMSCHVMVKVKPAFGFKQTPVKTRPPHRRSIFSDGSENECLILLKNGVFLTSINCNVNILNHVTKFQYEETVRSGVFLNSTRLIMIKCF
jgi:hypothetical protein